jgi:subtilisin family serine protease
MNLFVATLIMAICTQIAVTEDREYSGPSTMRHGKYSPDAIPGLVIVKFKQGVSFRAGGRLPGVAAVDEVLQRIGATRVEDFGRPSATTLRKAGNPDLHSSRMVKVFFPENVNPIEVARELSEHDAVEYAEPSYSVPLQRLLPNDPRVEQQWAIEAMMLPEAWAITTGDSNIVIANVDTGVDWKHEDLALNIWINPGEWGINGELSNNGIDDDDNGKVDDWMGWDFIGAGTGGSWQPDNDPMDGVTEHGTQVAGCHSARTDNSIGIAGSSWHSKILPVKVAGDSDERISAGYEGILYAAQMGAKIINCSWSGGGFLMQMYQDMIDDATALGSLVISGSGNVPVDNDFSPQWPSSFFNVLNVGSIERSGEVSDWCVYGTSVDVYAPGKDVTTTRPGGRYSNPSGTSISAPLAAGVAALVWSVNPDWTPAQVATQLRVTSDRFGDVSESKYYGRLNAYRAVTLNRTLSDIPGIRLANLRVQVSGGGRTFSKVGQWATVTMTLENVLAPTSEHATATLAIDDPSLTTQPASFSIGNMNTFDRIDIEFDVELSRAPLISEGFAALRVRIDDGEYTDFILGRIAVDLDDGWESRYIDQSTTITDISRPNFQTGWAVGRSGVRDIPFRSTDGGGFWLSADGNGFPFGRGVTCISSFTTIMAAVGTAPSSALAEVYTTTDGGVNWSAASVSDITGALNWIHLYNIRVGMLQGNPKNGIWGIARSSDGGRSWLPIANSVAAEEGEKGWPGSYDSVGDTLWFGSNKYRIYRSVDRGMTWSSFPTPGMNSVDISFADGRRGVALFALRFGYGEHMLATTRNGGESWRRVTSIEVNSARAGVYMERGGTRLWLLQGAAVYVSSDHGETWRAQAIPQGFMGSTMAGVSSETYTDVNAGHQNMYRYRSRFQRHTISSAPPVAGTDDFRIDYLYPNPVTGGSSVLGFTVGATASVRVELYDNLGRLHRVVLDARLSSGTHSVRIDTAEMAPGSYHVRVHQGQRVLTRALNVLR